MARRVSKIILFVVMLAISVTTFPLLRPNRVWLPVSLKIELNNKDPQAYLGKHVSVDASGTLYTVEQVNGKYFYHAYSPEGKTIWRVEDRKCMNSNEVLVSLPGAKYGPLNWYLGQAGEQDWSTGELRWVAVSEQGKVSSKVLIRDPKPGIEFLDALSAPGGLYAVGTSEDAKAVAARFDTAGTRRWMRIEKSPPTEYERATIDSRGNLIASYDPSGIGIFIAKYSPEGRLIWLKKEVSIKNGASTIWLSADKSDRIFALIRLHHTLWLTLNEAALFSKHGSRFVSGESDGAVDESGRDQDYVLMTIDSEGKLLRRKVLSHGAWLTIEDAVMDDNGKLFMIGNRQKVNSYGFPTESDNAELIKCSSKSDVIWSRSIRLPQQCFAKGITLGSNSMIYTVGDSRGYMSKKPVSPSRLFIYKVAGNE